MRVAIIGSGVSGLVAAHQLYWHHDVTVFEASARIGGHVSTVDVLDGDRRHAIDTGFIVYNERTYPNFTRLLAQLGVETQPTEMSFGVSCERTGTEWASRGLASVFAQRSNLLKPEFWRMLRDLVRFNSEARKLAADSAEKVTLGDYLCGAGYSQRFVDHYIVPMGAAIWSAEPRAFLDFPASSFVRFFENHGLLETPPSLQWRVVRGGSARYVEKLVSPFLSSIRVSSPVRSLRRRADGVEIESRHGLELFDRVVLATHSDQALEMLADASPLERAVLSRIRYQRNEVVLHTDESLMPKSRRADASWNYRIPNSEHSGAIVTYDMNRLQGIDSPTRFLVTLNATDRIDPRKRIAEFDYDHPVFDADALNAQQQRSKISGDRRTHYCGAYWGYGFHEDGVRSALAVCRELGVEDSP